jgi:hypothetical protein
MRDISSLKRSQLLQELEKLAAQNKPATGDERVYPPGFLERMAERVSYFEVRNISDLMRNYDRLTQPAPIDPALADIVEQHLAESPYVPQETQSPSTLAYDLLAENFSDSGVSLTITRLPRIYIRNIVGGKIDDMEIYSCNIYDDQQEKITGNIVLQAPFGREGKTLPRDVFEYVKRNPSTPLTIEVEVLARKGTYEGIKIMRGPAVVVLGVENDRALPPMSTTLRLLS